MTTTMKNKKEIRSAFTNFLLGTTSITEARSLGVDINNGKATIPKSVAEEIIGYVEQENLLRKYGKVVTVDGNLGYPVLTGDTKVEVGVDKKERDDENEIEVNHLGLTAELLEPVEFTSISTIKKKLLKMTPISVSDLVIDVMKKEYLKKEMDYMFNGTDTFNPGSLLNKAKVFTPTQTEPVAIIKELKNKPSTSIANKARWIVNKAALEYVEDLKLPNGEPALKTIDRVDGGVSYMLLGFPLDCTDVVKGSVDTAALFYFGDFSSFVIQEKSTGLEVETMNETYSLRNEVGFKLYNLLDGKLIYSEVEPTVYRLEIK
ncbi:phage major capsid protein [Bacillus cereus]|uniref:phage major capsid protein n=1 Tax=Bacillus cereus group TaxID=86661 RepID=UPI000B44FDB0|nr:MULTISPECIES: phage major capsid protein [Bacillus cereus group]MEB9735594.1 phage major capsid protein [Bacillus cereus]OTW76450.1 phage major capsid protein [Bacillus thuringiensis serovar jinghongiensis]OTX14337.1 phage major capsid protein [Bacillus thuringiensis serovar japonensis]TKH90660.1 phage major capsid protein [Bacillus cereus]WBO72294.1 phage major capsid protein [Bacillus cereus]